MRKIDIDTVLAAYLTCAAWSTPDADGGSLEGYEFTKKAVAQARRDCREFVRMARVDLFVATGLDDEQIGHDFWLTREGHGAGFWDRGLGVTGDRLTEIAKTFGSGDLYLHRNRLHFA